METLPDDSVRRPYTTEVQVLPEAIPGRGHPSHQGAPRTPEGQCLVLCQGAPGGPICNAAEP